MDINTCTLTQLAKVDTGSNRIYTCLISTKEIKFLIKIFPKRKLQVLVVKLLSFSNI